MNTTNNELLATRQTFDGKTVQLWGDGVVTVGGMAKFVKGCGVAKTSEGRSLDIEAGWLLMGEVAVIASDELPNAVKSARAAVRAATGLAERIAAFRQPKVAKKNCRASNETTADAGAVAA